MVKKYVPSVVVARVVIWNVEVLVPFGVKVTNCGFRETTGGTGAEVAARLPERFTSPEKPFRLVTLIF